MQGDRIGECRRCRHAAVKTSGRGGAFWRCLLADTDDRFARYPPLPVSNCEGFVERRLAGVRPQGEPQRD